MKILIIEDLEIGEYFKKKIKDSLSAEVVWVQSMSGFIRHLDLLEDIHSFDAIVCDHNFPSFPEEIPSEMGNEVFMELFHNGYKGKFIHFSAQPCPEKYDLKDESNSKIEFHSLKKRKI